METITQTPNSYLVFSVGEQCYAIATCRVRRVLRAADITPLPGAPFVVRGLINIAGQVVPVIDIFRRLGMTEHPLRLRDRFIVLEHVGRILALLVENVSHVLTDEEGNMVEGAQIYPDMGPTRGVVKLKGGLALIQDLDAFLTADEADRLGQALQGEYDGS